MRLLLLLFVTCYCAYAGRAVFNCDQQEVLKKLKDDTTEFEKRIELLIETLKKASKASSAKKVEEPKPLETADKGAGKNGPKSTEPEVNPRAAADGDTDAKSLNNAIAKLDTFPNETALSEFRESLAMDLFPDGEISNVFDQIHEWISDPEIASAVKKHCESPAEGAASAVIKCHHPFKTLSEESSKNDSLLKLKSVKESYEHRPDQDKVRDIVVSNLSVNITRKLNFLKETIQNELSSTDAESIPYAPDLSRDLSLSAKVLAEVSNGIAPKEAVISKALDDLSVAVRAARSALAACKAVLDKEGNPSCSDPKVPFGFTLDPSYMKAFEDMVEKYKKRPESKEGHSKTTTVSFRKRSSLFRQQEPRDI